MLKNEEQQLNEVREYTTYYFKEYKKEIKEISTKKLEEERIHIFLTKLFHIQKIFVKKENDELSQDGLFDSVHNAVGAYMPSHHIRIILGKTKYERILSALESLKMIKITSVESKQFYDARVIQLSSVLMNSKKKENKTHTPSALKILNQYHDEYSKRLGNFNENFFFNYKNKFSITQKSFNEIMGNRYDEKKDRINTTKEKYIQNHQYVFENMKFLSKNNNLGNAVFFYLQDKFSGRIHSTFSSLPKQLRNTIQIYSRKKGKYINFLKEIDVRNAQMLFFAKCVQDEMGSSVFADLANDDVDIYEHIKREYRGVKQYDYKKKEHYYIETRDDAKKFAFSLIFMNSYSKFDKKKVKKKMQDFASRFPNEGRYLIELQKGLKEKSRKQISAKRMQMLEVEAFAEVWEILRKENINWVNVHDSIIVDVDDAERAEEIVREVLDEKLKGVFYQLHVDKLNKKKVYNSIQRKPKSDKISEAPVEEINEIITEEKEPLIKVEKPVNCTLHLLIEKKETQPEKELSRDEEMFRLMMNQDLNNEWLNKKIT